MNVCFLGKYPPIEGGVSTTNYWAARGLAQRGHEVHVVTNAFEVEPNFRMALRPDDEPWLEPAFEETGGLVKVYPTPGINQLRLYYVPRSNPFVTKLASVATQVIRAHDCEAVYASYFEPYGVAGYLASTWTGLPLIVKHAGSDLGHLMLDKGISESYREVLRAAQAVLTSEGLVSRFASVGVDTARIYPSPVLPLPPQSVFSPDDDGADAREVLSRAQKISTTDPSALDLSKPSIGIYGKVGAAKGSFDLIEALARVREQGLAFNFLAMTQGYGLDRFKEAVQRAGLDDCTWLVPFMPNWRVPRFIRTCTAVCFLERDFPIMIHGPRVPREILGCGTCLILSGEIVNKQTYRSSMSDGENLITVDDPKDIDKLAAAIEAVVRDPERANRIGQRGFELSQEFDSYEDFVSDLEHIVYRAAGKPSAARSFKELQQEADAQVQDPNPRIPFLRFLSPMIPWVDLFDGDQFSEAASYFIRRQNGAHTVDPGSTVRFLQYLEDELRAERLNAGSPLVDEIIRFERARLQVKWGLEVDEPSALPSLKAWLHTNGAVDQKKPRLKHGALVESFRHQVTPLFREDDMPANGDTATQFHDRAGSAKKVDHGVIFQRLPNGQSRVFTVGAVTRDLIIQCNGDKRVNEIIDGASAAYGLPGDGGAEFRKRLRSAFEALQQQDIIVLEA